MVRIDINNLRKSYCDKNILNIKHLVLNEGDKVGLVGLNGSGKSTLLNIIAGVEPLYDGNMLINGKISYFRQFDKIVDKINCDKLTSEFELTRVVNNGDFSGGEAAKIRLISVLNEKSDIYLFDEPDANIDYVGKQQLKQKLMKIPNFILVSHDESILTECCNVIWYLNAGNVIRYDGNYKKFRELQYLEELTKKREYEDYISEKKKLEGIYEKKVKAAKSIQKKVSNSDTKARNFGSAGKSYDGKQKSLMKASKNVKKRIEHLEVKEAVSTVEKVKMASNHFDSIVAKNVISAENLSFSYGNNLIFNKCDFFIAKGSKVAIVGKNGCGKTTLLNLLVSQNKKIYIAPKVKIGYVMQNFEDLMPDMTVLESIRDKSIQNDSVNRTILKRLLFDEFDINKKTSILSGGEKMRCSIARLLVSDCNVLVFDEPTNYLDINTIEALESLLKEYQGNIIFVSHDTKFVEKVATDVLFIENKKILSHHGKLSDYKSTQKDVNKTMLELKLIELNEKMKNNLDNTILEEEYIETINALKLLKSSDGKKGGKSE